jgi:hypothetical protein
MKRTTKTTKKKVNQKLKEQEFKKYLEKVEDPNYQGGSWALPEKASLLEKSKYNLCKKMIVYKREKRLTTEKLAQKINLSLAETEDILHYRTNYFTLDRLMTYTSKLFPTSEVEISLKDKEKRIRLSRF